MVSPTSMKRIVQTLFISCGLLLAVGLVFGRTVHYRFIILDDGECVYKNRNITDGLTIDGVKWAFTHSCGGTYTPVAWISHMIDCQLYGLDAGKHHRTNVLLHAATAVLLFLVLGRMTGRQWPSALVAVVFAIHPLRVESVAWVTERKDVLGGLFFVLTLAAYLHYVRRRSFLRYLSVMVLFALGLLAKPMLVTLPVVLLLLDYWPLGRYHRQSTNPQSLIPNHSCGAARLVLEKLPMLPLAIVIGVAAVLVTKGVDSSYFSDRCFRFWWRLGGAPIAYVRYLGMFFYPVNLAIPYPRSGADMSPWKIVGAVSLLVLLTAAAIVWGRKRPYLPVGWLWYLVMLTPVSGLWYFDMHGFTTVADRFTYLPQIGLCIVLAWGLADAVSAASFPKSVRLRRSLCGVAAAAMLMALAYTAWRQTSYWRDDEALWSHTLACTERNRMAHHALGNVYLERGDAYKAIGQFQDAVAIDPDYVTVHWNLGVALETVGRIDEAIEQYRETIRLDPTNAVVRNNLGHALIIRREFADGMAEFREALRIDPELAEAHLNVGDVLFSRNRVENAVAEYRKALKSRPDFAPARYHLGLALAQCGRYDEAIAEYRKALRTKPSFAAEIEASLQLAEAARGR
jgi:protein O-mannosyl-transferase